MKKYVGIFILAYLPLTIIFTMVLAFLPPKSANMFIVLLPIMLASSFTGTQFSKQEDRRPTKSEASVYTWLALLSVWLVDILLIILAAALLQPSELYNIQTLHAVLVQHGVKAYHILIFFLSVSLIYFLTIRWNFSWSVKISLAKENR